MLTFSDTMQNIVKHGAKVAFCYFSPKIAVAAGATMESGGANSSSIHALLAKMQQMSPSQAFHACLASVFQHELRKIAEESYKIATDGILIISSIFQPTTTEDNANSEQNPISAQNIESYNNPTASSLAYVANGRNQPTIAENYATYTNQDLAMPNEAANVAQHLDWT